MKRYHIFVNTIVVLLAFVLLFRVQPAISAPSGIGNGLPVNQQGVKTETPTDQIIVKFKDANLAKAAALPAQAMLTQRLNEAAGTSLTYLREMSGGATVYKLPGKSAVDQVSDIAKKLTALPEVEYAEPDAIMQIMFAPNDPQYANQWHYFPPAAGHYGIDMPAAWDITQGASNVVVAVIDTGITDHLDLAGRTVPGYDFIHDISVSNDGDGRDADPHDPGDWVIADQCYSGSPAENSSWHGTHTAGTIGAASNNGVGVAGINWISKILPVRVLGQCGGYVSDIADGMVWAAGLPVSGVPANANPAKVLSLSLGGYAPSGCSSTYQTAINAITAAGATVVVAAGNSTDEVSLYQPANCNGVISVAATDRNGSMAYYSNYGSSIKISAPGGAQSYANDPNGVLSTLNSGLTTPSSDVYVYYQGTSMATPHVSGVASLLYSINPTITSAQVLQILQNTVTAFPGTSSCTTSLCGPGILNAGNAVRPHLTSLIPGFVKKGSGPVNLKVYGFNFNSNSKVQWNGTPLTTTLTSSFVLSATIPATDLTTSGTYSVTVKTNFATIGDYVTPALPFTVRGQANFLPLVLKPSQVINGDFESGSTGWTEFSTHGWPLILNSGFPPGKSPHSGVYAVWLGGDNSELSYIQQQVKVNAAAPYLAYWQWIESAETTCGNDHGGVTVNGIWFDLYNLCTSVNTGGWVKHVVNLSAYSGQTITLQIRSETNATVISNLFIDDVSFQSTPTLAEANRLYTSPGAEIFRTKPEVFQPK